MTSKYEGKRGRHPADCDCSVHSQNAVPADTNSPTPTPSANGVSPTAGTAPINPQTAIENLLREGELKDNIIPPQSQQKTETPSGEKEPAKTKTFSVSPKLLKFIGDKLANMSKIEGYRLTDDEATDIAGAIDDYSAEKGIKVSNSVNLWILIIIWLGIPTIEYVFKNKEKLFKKKEDKMKGLSDGQTTQTG